MEGRESSCHARIACAANDPIEDARWRVKCPDIAAPDHIGSAHHAEPLALECVVEHPDTREQRENEIHRATARRAIMRRTHPI